MTTRFYGDAMVVFHHINAYEDAGHLVFDLISYKDSSLYDMFYIQNIKQEISSFIESNKSFSPPVCQRFVLPINANKVLFESKTHPKTGSCILGTVGLYEDCGHVFSRIFPKELIW